ncbi:MAG TPA: hypothetical protein VJA47_03655 [archaeon]|nr:hypothetical protein [archaeon]
MSFLGGLVVEGGVFLCADEAEVRDGAIGTSDIEKIRSIRDCAVGYVGDSTYGNGVLDVFIESLILNDDISGFNRHMEELARAHGGCYNAKFQRVYLDPYGVQLKDLLRGRTDLDKSLEQELLKSYRDVRKNFNSEFLLAGFNKEENRFEIGTLFPGDKEHVAVSEYQRHTGYFVIGKGHEIADAYIDSALRALSTGHPPRHLGARVLVDAMEEVKDNQREKAVAGDAHLFYLNNDGVHQYPKNVGSAIAVISKLQTPGGVISDKRARTAFRDLINQEDPEKVAMDLPQGARDKMFLELVLRRGKYFG